MSPTTDEHELAARLTQRGTALGEAFLSWATAARAEQPALELDLDVFARHVARVIVQSRERQLDFIELNAADLLLASCCTRQDAAALALFEAKYLQPLRCFVAEIDANPPRLDELKQMLRERLLVAESRGALPRIAAYSGRGSLGAWLQIAARRLALNSLRQRKTSELPDDDALDAQLLGGADPELEYARLRYAEEFRQAFELSLQALSSHERLLVRLHWLEGVSLTRIARVYKVSQSTISRRLQQARATVGASVKQRLTATLGITPTELDSLLRILDSRFQLSLARALQSRAAVLMRTSGEPPETGRS